MAKSITIKGRVTLDSRKLKADLKQMRSMVESTVNALNKKSKVSPTIHAKIKVDGASVKQQARQSGKTFESEYKKAFKSASKSLGKDLKRVALTAGVALAGIGAGVAKGLKTSKAIDSTLQTLRALSKEGEATGDVMKGLRAEMRQVASDLPLDAEDVAKGMESLKRAGKSLTEVKDEIREVSEFAVANKIDVEKAANAALKTSGVLGISLSESMDLLQTSANNANQSVLDVMKTIQNTKSIKQIDADAFSVMSQVLANEKGITSSKQGTELSRFFSGLQTRAEEVGELLNFDVYNEDGSLKGHLELMTKAREAAKLLTDEQKAGLEGIFGKQGLGYITASAQMADDVFQTAIDNAKNMAGSVGKASEIMQQGFSATMNTLDSNIKNFYLSLGEGAKPAAQALASVATAGIQSLLDGGTFDQMLNEVGTKIGSMFGTFTELDDGTQLFELDPAVKAQLEQFAAFILNVMRQIGQLMTDVKNNIQQSLPFWQLVGSAAQGIAKALGTVLMVVSRIVASNLTGILTVAAAMAAKVGAAALVAAAPVIGMKVAIVAAVVAAGMLVQKLAQNKTVMDALRGIVDKVKELIGKGVKLAVELGNKIKAVWDQTKGLRTQLSNIVSQLMARFINQVKILITSWAKIFGHLIKTVGQSKTFNSILTKIKVVVGAIFGVIKFILGVVLRVVKAAQDLNERFGITDKIVAMINAGITQAVKILDVVTGIVDFILSLTIAIVESVVNWIRETGVLQKAVDFVAGLFKDILGFIQRIIGGVKTFAAENRAVSTILHGIKGTFSSIGDVIDNLVTRTIEWAKKFGPIKRALEIMNKMRGGGDDGSGDGYTTGTGIDFSKLVTGGDDSILMRAIGLTEGNRTLDGGKTSTYDKHWDPVGKKYGRGSVSDIHGRSPEEAAKHWNQTLLKSLETHQQKIADAGFAGDMQIALNVADMRVQSPGALAGDGGFIDKLPELKKALEGINDVAKRQKIINEFRTDSYRNPTTGKLETSFSSRGGLLKDQARRGKELVRFINEYQSQLNGAIQNATRVGGGGSGGAGLTRVGTKAPGVSNALTAKTRDTKTYARTTRTGKKDKYGLEILKVDLIENGKVVESMFATAGTRGNQNFQRADSMDHKLTGQGSGAPIQEGQYTMFDPTRTYSGDKVDAMGSHAVRIGGGDMGKTGRAGIEFHEDANRLTKPGSIGCIVFNNKEDIKRLVKFTEDNGPTDLLVDWGLGTFGAGFEELDSQINNTASAALSDAANDADINLSADSVDVDELNVDVEGEDAPDPEQQFRDYAGTLSTTLTKELERSNRALEDEQKKLQGDNDLLDARGQDNLSSEEKQTYLDNTKRLGEIKESLDNAQNVKELKVKIGSLEKKDELGLSTEGDAEDLARYRQELADLGVEYQRRLDINTAEYSRKVQEQLNEEQQAKFDAWQQERQQLDETARLDIAAKADEEIQKKNDEIFAEQDKGSEASATRIALLELERDRLEAQKELNLELVGEKATLDELKKLKELGIKQAEGYNIDTAIANQERIITEREINHELERRNSLRSRESELANELLDRAKSNVESLDVGSAIQLPESQRSQIQAQIDQTTKEYDDASLTFKTDLDDINALLESETTLSDEKRSQLEAQKQAIVNRMIELEQLGRMKIEYAQTQIELNKQNEALARRKEILESENALKSAQANLLSSAGFTDKAAELQGEIELSNLKAANEAKLLEFERRKEEIKIRMQQAELAHAQALAAIKAGGGTPEEQAAQLAAQESSFAETQAENQAELDHLGQLVQGENAVYEANKQRVEFANSAKAQMSQAILKTAMNDLSTGIHDVIMGTKTLGQVFGDMLKNIASQLIKMATQKLVQNAFGGALGGAGGGANSGGFLGAITKALGFNDGGFVPYEPGTTRANKDTVPAMLTQGEGVLTRDEVRALGGRRGFENFRKQIRAYNSGGYVSGRTSSPTLANNMARRQEVNYKFETQMIGSTEFVDANQVRQLEARLNGRIDKTSSDMREGIVDSFTSSNAFRDSVGVIDT